MIDLLRELELELSRAAPGIAATLLPRLPLESIDRLLEELPQPVPQDLRTLYSWHDGTDYDYGAYRAEIFRGGMFLPLHEALANRAGGMESASGWDERWLPIFTDEHTLFDCVVCGSGGGAVVTFAYLDLPSFHVDYLSLGDLIRSLIKRWQIGIYWIRETGEVSLDPRALAALRREEDGHEPDVSALVQALRSTDESEWTGALWRLRTRLYPSAVPALTALLVDGPRHNRWHTVELLAEIRDPSAKHALTRAASDDLDEHVRKYAAKVLEEWE
jgi:HEAT repeat protein